MADLLPERLDVQRARGSLSLSPTAEREQWHAQAAPRRPSVDGADSTGQGSEVGA